MLPPQNLVSVIIPTKNRNEFLMRAIQSVVVQTYRPLEICIADNNSSEVLSAEIREIIAVFQSAHPHINWIYFKSSKAYSGGVKNDALSHVNSSFICFLDDDDELFPSSIALRMELMLSEEDVALVYCAGYSKIYPYPFMMYRYYHHFQDQQHALLRMMSCSSMMINVAVFRANDVKFDERLSRLEDFDLGKQLLEKEMKIKSTSQGLVILHQHPQERMSTFHPNSIQFFTILEDKWGDFGRQYVFDYFVGHYLWRRCFQLDHKSYTEVVTEIEQAFSQKPSFVFRLKYWLVSCSPMIYLAFYHLLLVAYQTAYNRSRFKR